MNRDRREHSINDEFNVCFVKNDMNEEVSAQLCVVKLNRGNIKLIFTGKIQFNAQFIGSIISVRRSHRGCQFAFEISY